MKQHHKKLRPFYKSGAVGMESNGLITMHNAKAVSLKEILLLTACVTINVYFPAAAAESAADRIIEEVYGEDGSLNENSNESEGDSQSGKSQPDSP